MTGAPPSDEAAERAVLGAVLIGAHDLPDAANLLRGRDFYQPRHGTIWDACLQVDRDGMRPDPVTVARALGPELAGVGGHPFLLELIAPEVAPHPAQLLHYARQVADTAVRRRLVEAGQRVIQMAHQTHDAAQAAQDARHIVDTAAETASTADSGDSLADSVDPAIDWLENPPVGAVTPWPDVTRATNGMLDGQMVTVGARPGGGKSLVASNVALTTAQTGRAVHIATLEMNRNEYVARLLANLGRVDLGRMYRRELTDSDWERIGRARDKLTRLPIVLDDRPSQTMAQVRAAARTTARRFGGQLGLVAVDYAQLVRPADTQARREEQVSQVSRDTKLMAKEFRCPALLLAQLNRKSTERGDGRPMVSDLRESGSLEQDSDQVWLLHRPDQVDPEDRPGEVELIVGKNRAGQSGVVISLSFQGHYATIASMA